VGGVAAAFGDLLRETLTRCGRGGVTTGRPPGARCSRRGAALRRR